MPLKNTGESALPRGHWMSQHEEPGEGQDKNNIEKWSTRLTAVKAQDLRPEFHTGFQED